MSEPTVVFVHGAFADSPSWNGVITRLMVSQPQAVSDVILEAVAAVASVPVEA